jgi:hypothetical protein
MSVFILGSIHTLQFEISKYLCHLVYVHMQSNQIFLADCPHYQCVLCI